VILTVDNSDAKLRPKMTANVTIVVSTEPDVLRVPNAALRFRPVETGTSAGAGGADGSRARDPERAMAQLGRRGPGGAALQLGAQHSQALESWFAHVPGLKVVAPATPYDAKGLLKAAIRDDNPVVFLEGEMLYNTKGEVPDEEYTVPLGVADVKRAGTDVTLVCHSKTVSVALKAAEQLAVEHRLDAEVVDLRTLRPLDLATLTASLRKTHRCVIVEEGWPFCGIGAQVVDDLQREAFDDLDAPILRVTQADVPMPYNRHLERAAKPTPERVVAAVRQVAYLDEPRISQ